MIYFRFAGYGLIFLFSLGCFFRFRSDSRRWFFLTLAAAMALMAISAASSRLAHRNELAARGSVLQHSIENQKERLAKVDPQKIDGDPKLRAERVAVQKLQSELDALAVAPAILPSGPWNAVEGWTALGGIACQIIGLIQVMQWYRSAKTLKADVPRTGETKQPAV